MPFLGISWYVLFTCIHTGHLVTECQDHNHAKWLTRAAHAEMDATLTVIVVGFRGLLAC